MTIITYIKNVKHCELIIEGAGQMQETGKHYEKAYWTNRQKLQYISGIVIITVSVIAGFKYVFLFGQEFSFVMNVQKSWQNKDTKNR